MKILGIRCREMEYYGEDDTIDYVYYVADEENEEMTKKLKKLGTICNNYDSYQEVEDYIDTHFTKVDVDILEFIV